MSPEDSLCCLGQTVQRQWNWPRENETFALSVPFAASCPSHLFLHKFTSCSPELTTALAHGIALDVCVGITTCMIVSPSTPGISSDLSALAVSIIQPIFSNPRSFLQPCSVTRRCNLHDVVYTLRPCTR